jgi:hypothetical protein
VATGAARQMTASDVASQFVGRSDDGRLVAIESRGDLVPASAGGPGNADGSLEVFVYEILPGRLVQVTASAADARFAAFVPRSRFVAFTCSADLVAGDNADGSQEVFLADLRTRAVRQVTASAGDTDLLEVGGAPHRWAVLRSTGDLRPDVPGGGTGTADLYVQRLRTVPTRAQRLTSGDDDAAFGGFGPRSRRLAIDTTAELVPGGNGDGSREAYLVALGATRATPQQITDTGFDTEVAAVSAGYPLVVLESRGDLVPGGNGDASLEVYVHRYGRVPQR